MSDNENPNGDGLTRLEAYYLMELQGDALEGDTAQREISCLARRMLPQISSCWLKRKMQTWYPS